MVEAVGALRRVVGGGCSACGCRPWFDGVVMVDSEELGDRDLPRRGVDLPRPGFESLPAHRRYTFELDTGCFGSLSNLHRLEGEGRFWVPGPAVIANHVKCEQRQ